MRGIVFLITLVCAGALAASAAAAEPTRTPFDRVAETTVSGACAFDVAITAEVHGVLTTYVDASGQVTRLAAHTTERDTFSANGKTLVGSPYPTNARLVFDTGGNVVAVGLFAKVRLPDGTLDLAAGRTTADPTGPFVFSPDVGRQFDLAAFCAAFS